MVNLEQEFAKKKVSKLNRLAKSVQVHDIPYDPLVLLTVDMTQVKLVYQSR